MHSSDHKTPIIIIIINHHHEQNKQNKPYYSFVYLSAADLAAIFNPVGKASCLCYSDIRSALPGMLNGVFDKGATETMP